MNNNINQLIKDYKQTGKKELMDQIYNILNPILQEKASYIYYRKVYKKNDKYINLKETNMVEHSEKSSDILQELWIEVMKIIQKYDPSKPFMNYFYSTLWRWRPSFIDENFLFQNSIVLESSLITEENLNPLDNLQKVSSKIDPEFEELNEKENEIIKVIFCNPSIKQEELAKKFNLSQTSISNIMIEIRRKLKKYK